MKDILTGNGVKKTKRRKKADEGNILHKLYFELGNTKRQELRDVILENGIPYSTFMNDRGKKDLGTIDLKRYAVYASFFGAENMPLTDLVVDTKTEPITEEVL